MLFLSAFFPFPSQRAVLITSSWSVPVSSLEFCAPLNLRILPQFIALLFDTSPPPLKRVCPSLSVTPDSSSLRLGLSTQNINGLSPRDHGAEAGPILNLSLLRPRLCIEVYPPLNRDLTEGFVSVGNSPRLGCAAPSSCKHADRLRSVSQSPFSLSPVYSLLCGSSRGSSLCVELGYTII